MWFFLKRGQAIPPANADLREQYLAALRLALVHQASAGRVIRVLPDGREFFERSGEWEMEVAELLDRVGASDAGAIFGLGGHGILEEVPGGGLRQGIERRCVILDGLVNDIDEYGSSSGELPALAEFPRLGPAWLRTVATAPALAVAAKSAQLGPGEPASGRS
ncbi:MAG: hypothetical protein JWM85_3496 [Acidimicrobiaceae bacterium]|nr:hypothetical protein [Acidimicrobiaceae bacterium]